MKGKLNETTSNLKRPCTMRNYHKKDNLAIKRGCQYIINLTRDIDMFKYIYIYRHTYIVCITQPQNSKPHTHLK